MALPARRPDEKGWRGALCARLVALRPQQDPIVPAGPSNWMAFLRHRDGVEPITSPNVRVKCAWSLKPQARAIWHRLDELLTIIVWARSTRRWATNLEKVRPKDWRKRREK